MKVFQKILDWFTLQRRARALAQKLDAELKQCQEIRKELEVARANMMRLYCEGHPAEASHAWEVSAFIPLDTIDRLKNMSAEKRDLFERTVAQVLVKKAIDGIHRIRKHEPVRAWVFEPVSMDSHLRQVSVWTDKDRPIAIAGQKDKSRDYGMEGMQDGVKKINDETARVIKDIYTKQLNDANQNPNP